MTDPTILVLIGAGLQFTVSAAPIVRRVARPRPLPTVRALRLATAAAART